MATFKGYNYITWVDGTLRGSFMMFSEQFLDLDWAITHIKQTTTATDPMITGIFPVSKETAEKYLENRK